MIALSILPSFDLASALRREDGDHDPQTGPASDAFRATLGEAPADVVLSVSGTPVGLSLSADRVRPGSHGNITTQGDPDTASGSEGRTRLWTRRGDGSSLPASDPASDGVAVSRYAVSDAGRAGASLFGGGSVFGAAGADDAAGVSITTRNAVLLATPASGTAGAAGSTGTGEGPGAAMDLFVLASGGGATGRTAELSLGPDALTVGDVSFPRGDVERGLALLLAPGEAIERK